MKAHTLTLIFVVAFVATISAQDTLFLNSGRILRCKMLEVGMNAVKFRKLETPDGPIYSLSRSQLSSVHYADGSHAFLEEAPITAASSIVAVHVAGMEDQFIPDYDPTVYNTPQVESRTGAGAQLLGALFILGAAIHYAEKQKDQQNNSNGSYNKKYQVSKCRCSSYSRCSQHNK